MIKFNFNQTGGFKIITQVLSRMQDSYSIINGVAKMAGDKAILSGCVVTGTNVSDGTVVIGNETLDFVGGILQTTVIIVETVTNASFKDGSVKPFETYRYATFGFSATALNWIDFKRVPVLNTLESRIALLEKAAAPIINGGARVLWNKAANLIPTGWAEDTDFAGRMPVGLDASQIDFDTVGKSLGEKNHQLTIAELPAHTFEITAYLGTENRVPNTGTGQNGNNQTITSNSVGGDQTHNNMSPYRIVIYIKYVG